MAHQRIDVPVEPEEQGLTPEQKQAWEHIRASFDAAGMTVPPKGFMRRWETRFAAQRVEDERRVAWALLGVNAAVASVLFILVTANVLPALSSPLDLFAEWMEGAVASVAFLQAIATTVVALVRTLPGVIPISLWLSGFAGMVALVGLWGLALNRYALQQGVVR